MDGRGPLISRRIGSRGREFKPQSGRRWSSNIVNYSLCFMYKKNVNFTPISFLSVSAAVDFDQSIHGACLH